MTNHSTEPTGDDAQLHVETTQALIGVTLTDIDALLPLVAALTSSRQRGLGFLTWEAKQAQAAQAKKEARDRRLREQAGQPIGPGERPTPGNLAGLSVEHELWFTLRDQVRRATRDLLRTRAMCTTFKLPKDPTSRQLIDHLRFLVGDITTPHVLDYIAHDLAAAFAAAKQLIDGQPRTKLTSACPHCGRRTLVVYFEDTGEDIIRCDRDPRTGHYETCTCPDPLCACKTRPVSHRHTWYRARGTGPDGWLTLANRLTITRTTQGAS